MSDDHEAIKAHDNPRLSQSTRTITLEQTDTYGNNHVHRRKTTLVSGQGGDVVAPLVIHSDSSSAHPDNKIHDSLPDRHEDYGDEDGARNTSILHSILLAEGLQPSSPPVETEFDNNRILPRFATWHRASYHPPSEQPHGNQHGILKALLIWWGALAVAGLGMFVEAYAIITTGQVKLVWHDQYPECWVPSQKQHCPAKIDCCGLFPNTPLDCTTAASMASQQSRCQADGTYQAQYLCSAGLLGSISYAEFAGIMAGMVTFGWVGDAIGRRSASVLAALLQILGLTVMTFFKPYRPAQLFQAFALFFAIFGWGIGGEYPLTATGAAQHDTHTAKELPETVAGDGPTLNSARRRHAQRIERTRTARRGETIGLVFAMQGVGSMIGSLFLVILIYFSNQTRITCDATSSNSTGNDPQALDSVWRSFYFIGLIFVIMLFLYRYLVLDEGQGHRIILERRRQRAQTLGPGVDSTWRILQLYWPKLIGTGGTWLVWDVAFYGLKLFSGPIFDSINPNGDLITQNAFLLLNNFLAMVGYFLAALVIDIPWLGRKKLQMMSFAVQAALFFLTAVIFPRAPTSLIIFLYFTSNFFGQFGANVTTYVMAAETYPTEVRGTCHGLSAFLGKMGALGATMTFSHLSTTQIFWTCAWAAVFGFLLTWVFSSDLTNVPLVELDAQLELYLEGRLEEYKGLLNHPRHLTNLERWTGNHGNYDSHWVAKLLQQEREKHLADGCAEPDRPASDLRTELELT